MGKGVAWMGKGVAPSSFDHACANNLKTTPHPELISSLHFLSLVNLFPAILRERAANMTNKCASCNKDFRTQEALNQHIRSPVHALRGPAGQLEVDSKLGLSASKLTPTPTHGPIQSRPTIHKTGVPQTYLVSTRQFCTPCNKPFKDVAALNQHLRNSKSHMSDTLPSARAQKVAIQTISRQTTVSVSTLDKRKPSRVDANASRARPQKALDQPGPVGSKQNSPRAVIPGPDIKVILEDLASYCHSPEDLLRNRYRLCPYSAEDIAGLRKCRKCGRKC